MEFNLFSFEVIEQMNSKPTISMFVVPVVVVNSEKNTAKTGLRGVLFQVITMQKKIHAHILNVKFVKKLWFGVIKNKDFAVCPVGSNISNFLENFCNAGKHVLVLSVENR